MLNYKQIWHGIKPIRWLNKFNLTSLSLEDVYEILRLPLFRDGEVVDISLSPDESKAMKFLEDALKKTLKKPILKAARKGKAPSDEVLEDTIVDRDKGSRVNFWGWIKYFWREYVDGMDEEANGDSLKEGIDFVVGEVTLALMYLKLLLAFCFLTIYLRDILMKRF